MSNVEVIISIFSFVLNPVLLSGFIIPQVQKLKEIKDQILKFKLTYVPSSGLSPAEEKDLRERQRKEIEELHVLFDTYRVRSKELSSLVWIFFIAILVAAVAIILIFARKNLINYIVAVHAFLQLCILVWAIKVYAINPDRLQDAGYLVREMDINPHSLVSALDLRLSIDSGKPVGVEISPEDPLRINLSTKLRVFGFRFLYIIYGEMDKVYFISFGPITAKTQLWRHLLPPDKFWGGGEYNRIELGSFQFNLVEEEKRLSIIFLVFLPFFKHEQLSPLVAYQEVKIERESGRLLTGMSGGMWPISTMTTIEDIVYRGEGTRIYELKWVGKEDDVLKKIIDRFGQKIIKTSKIKQYESIEGNLVNVNQ
jgi:hypothetical protein